MSVPADLVKAAKETYGLELLLNGGISTDALEKAIAAALEKHERNILEKVATRAETLAAGLEMGEEIAGTEDPYGDWGVPLRYFADQLRMGLGPQTDYKPQFGDVVEITLTGAVITYEDDQGNDLPEWSIFDDITGDEYFFGTHPKRKVRVRVLTRGEEIG